MAILALVVGLIPPSSDRALLLRLLDLGYLILAHKSSMNSVGSGSTTTCSNSLKRSGSLRDSILPAPTSDATVFAPNLVLLDELVHLRSTVIIDGAMSCLAGIFHEVISSGLANASRVVLPSLASRVGGLRNHCLRSKSVQILREAFVRDLNLRLVLAGAVLLMVEEQGLLTLGIRGSIGKILLFELLELLLQVLCDHLECLVVTLSSRGVAYSTHDLKQVKLRLTYPKGIHKLTEWETAIC